ncbi:MULTISPECIES: glycerophosphoryl diester phosphodiesterase membrane domain-containing protein [unclassified Microbacterium]|uniref:glycerophosphoryl diester phosphodiesterase membrane domain-containing protein n=1 Tax=unclassified Microbacterium TaxID=2609290 RepID=UPI002468A107|nr:MULTISPECIES: glycerophosphoryl diester phosphodiesterase membrane domain-containing protein [unclassified Microbacterium]MDH5133749.1 glycerophosphoryl diester phosphodiesterase membrane domain-containing protein [Microbacterium sp. RD10]MDH5137340.1 glycerophosphoryl diester phosphodiesterase membrane domain-containing protein [Microbacterium sp. RD11]MDH5145035.1 glycerophosphoryl diester phosphodiesterase membrane domain-containing protein [Microbacterium sp. RD12]MDH5155471.1 glyceropho
MSGQTWTPAPRKGIIPLHPLTFGMLLGKAFAALRHNPKVLFGFAVVIQLIVVVATAGVMGLVLFSTFSRLETVSPSSPDFEAVFAGTIAINLIAGLVVGLASVAFTAIMQGVVAAEVGYATVGVKATLRMLWRRMAPAFWRLAGFASLSVLALFGGLAIVAAVIAALIAGGLGATPEMIGIVVLVVVLLALAAIPLTVWLSTKLLLVPSILVLERARFREAFVRSWRLTRGRFWVAFGVTFLISLIMGLAMQVVSIPTAMFSSFLGTVIAPTGSSEPSAVIAYVFALLAPQVLLLILQAITIVVQSTGGVLVYLDCRMRYEGLDQTLLSHVERRDLGVPEDQLGDPFAIDPARAVTSAPPPRQVPEHVMMSQGYGSPAYGGPPVAPMPFPGAAGPLPTSPAPTAFAPPPPPAPAPPAPPSAEDAAGWTAPGSTPPS